MKQFVRPSLILVISFFLTVSGYAQNGQIEDIAEHAAQVTEFEINGLKVLVKRREAAPTFAAGLFFRGGVRNVTERNAGIENFALSVATEAGRKFPRQVLRRELSRTGSAIGGSSGRDFGAISFASTRQNFDRMWEMFADVTLEPTFAREDVERVRSQLLAALRESETSPDAALQAALERAIYAGHPYANHPFGTAKNVTAFTADDLRKHHRELLQTSRMLLVIVGDIDADDVKKKVTESFGKLPRGNYKDSELPELDFSTPTLNITQRNIATNYIQGNFAAPPLNQPDYFAMRVAMSILQQLVYQEIRLQRQLSYAPNAELHNNAANTAMVYASSVNANETVRVMFEQIDLLQEQLIREEFIAGMAGQFLTNYYIEQERNSAQVGELARYELIGGGWRKSFEFLNRIRAVSPEDVRRVSKKYMNNLRFVVVGNQDAVDRSVFLRGSAAEAASAK